MKKNNPFLDTLIGFLMSLLISILLVLPPLYLGGILLLASIGKGMAAVFLVVLLFLVFAFFLQIRLAGRYKNRGFVQLGIWLVYPIGLFSLLLFMNFIEVRREHNHQLRLETELKEAVYYRLKASYRHKDRKTGKMEKIVFDVVGDCRIQHFMKSTADGGAVMMYLPTGKCHDSSDFGQPSVPDDYMPFVVWYDDVHDTRFGWGYGSEDAYESPHSQLKFEGATLTKQNYTQWQAWRKQQKATFKPIGSIQSPFGWNRYGYGSRLSENKYRLSDRRFNPHYVATNCYSYRRIRLKGTFKKLTHKLWPANRPTYWMLPFSGRVKKSDEPIFNKLRLMTDKYGSYDLKIGVETRKGGGALGKDSNDANNDDPFYPTIKYRRARGGDIKRLDTRPRMKGFYACGEKDIASFNRVLSVKKHKMDERTRLFNINDFTVIKYQGFPPQDERYLIYKDKILWIRYEWS